MNWMVVGIIIGIAIGVTSSIILNVYGERERDFMHIPDIQFTTPMQDGRGLILAVHARDSPEDLIAVQNAMIIRLLEQKTCYDFYGDFSWIPKTLRERCGAPLNYTGVWP